MSTSVLTTVILAAGQGTRMTSDRHKVLHPVGGKPMLCHVLDVAERSSNRPPLVVVGALADQVRGVVKDRAHYVVQDKQLGTGHAVACCRDALAGYTGDVLVLYGDVPLITEDTLKTMRAARAGGAGLVVLGFETSEPRGYGRLITAPDGTLDRIVEDKDATDTERAVTLCNSGVMLMDWRWAQAALPRLEASNAAGEYYLTDLVALARADGLQVHSVSTTANEVAGVNSRADLAAVEALFQARERSRHMAAGVTMVAPDTVFLSTDTVIGRDVTLEPHVVIGPGVTIEGGATIKAFSHLEGCSVRSGASVGPYARLRPGADIGAGAKIGNFVEVKQATLAEGVKVSHLSYIGDATIGKDANIGAGTITCNYDGFNKYTTTIGAGAFIGSNTALVAPVSVGDGAIVGAGSVLTKDAPADGLSLTRAPQREIKGYAAKFRAKHNKDKS